MDRETLERLKLDRALGVLPPDCEALLTAYIQGRPADASDLHEIEKTVTLARRALRDEAPARLPEFPGERLRRAARSEWRRKMARNLTGIAASVLIGFGLRAAWFPTTESGHGGESVPVVAQGRIESVGKADSREAGFWSAHRLHEQRAAVQASQQPPRRLIWRSPVEVPEIGGAT
jgi:anti-sigma factor RsiW